MKRWMKAVVIFGIVFALVVITGSAGLMYYAEYTNRKAEENRSRADEIVIGPAEDPNAEESAAESSMDQNPAGSEEDTALSETAHTDILSDDGEEPAGEPLPMIETDKPAKESGSRAEESEMQSDGDNGSPEEDSKQSGPVVMTFTGDICFHDAFANMGAYRQRGSSIEKCIDAELLSHMRGADICVVNNEFPYSDRGAPLPDKAYAFRSKPSNVSILSDMGADVAGIANNHAFDHGPEAFLDTLEVLEGAGIPHAGGGRNLAEAAAPVILEKNGVKIGILAATQIERNESPDTRGATAESPGVMRCFSEKELAAFLEAIEKADAVCDVVVVFVHWGSENTDVLDFRQRDQAAAFAEAGADLIVGAHPHCLQGIGAVSGVSVVYSLGNFWFNSKRVDTALLEVVIKEKTVESVQFIPALQHDCRTDHLEEGEKQRILSYLNALAENGTSLDEEGFMHWQ